MKAVIHVEPEDLTSALLDKLKSLISDDKKFVISILVKEKPALNHKESLKEYLHGPDQFVKETEERDMVSFTTEEPAEYVTKKAQYITDDNGKKLFVILPIKNYQHILEELDELDDIRLYDETKAIQEPSIPMEEAFKLLEANRKKK
jgi:hypothetical protein